MSGAPIQFQQQLKFQIQKSPSISAEASLCWRNGWAGTPAGLSTLCQVHRYNYNNCLNYRYKKAPSFLTRLRCIGGTAGLVFHWAGTPAGLSTPCQVHQYNSNNGLKFQIQKSPVIADEASLCWRNGWAGIPLGWHSSGTLDLVSGAPIQLQQQLKFQIKKAPSMLTRLRCIGGTAGLVFHWAGTPAGLSTSCQVHQYNSNNGLKFQIQKSPVIADEASLCWRSGRDSNPRPPA